jgi:hypothetical protein
MKIADGVGDGERVLLNAMTSTQSSWLERYRGAARSRNAPVNHNYLSQ